MIKSLGGIAHGLFKCKGGTQVCLIKLYSLPIVIMALYLEWNQIVTKCTPFNLIDYSMGMAALVTSLAAVERIKPTE